MNPLVKRRFDDILTLAAGLSDPRTFAVAFLGCVIYGFVQAPRLADIAMTRYERAVDRQVTATTEGTKSILLAMQEAERRADRAREEAVRRLESAAALAPRK